jgi:hypothetical protein
MERLYSNVEKEKKKLEETFLSYFQNKKYQISKSVSLITKDNSILFTNATIIPWKKYILGEKMPEKGLCMKQPCLRLHVLNDNIAGEIHDETSFNRFLGYFNMLGLLTPSKNKKDVSNDLVDLLVKHYGIPTENIRVLASEKDSFVKSLEGIIDVHYNIEEDTFYRWTYGMEKVYGRGATFCLRQKDGEFKEIGQLIKITNSDGEDFFEAGFGLETFLSRMQSREDYTAWTIFHCVPKEYRFKTFLDLTSCFGASLSINPSLITRKHRKEIVRLAKRIVYIENILNIPAKDLEDSINKFINVEFNLDLRESVTQRLNHARELIQNE